jgi:taurine dioxygenase
MQIKRLGYALGAEIAGLDLRDPAEPAITAEIRQAVLDHIVICIRGQHLGRKHMRVFCENFGRLDDGSQSNFGDPNDPGIMMRTNKPIVIDGKVAVAGGGANLWHSDHSYSQHPNTLTFLSAQELPDIGGDTMFANMYMAYDALTPAFQSLIEPLSAVHDSALSGGAARATPEQLEKMLRRSPPVAHPVVKIHPETRRKALYVGKRIRMFAGMTEEESRPLLAFLNSHAVRYEFIYRHRWAPNDLLVWDNRCAMHYAVSDYDQQQTRRMMRCSLLGPSTGTFVDQNGAASSERELATVSP